MTHSTKTKKPTSPLIRRGYEFVKQNGYWGWRKIESATRRRNDDPRTRDPRLLRNDYIG